jgi:hypothetical protein
MTVLLKNLTEPEREAIISSIASRTVALSRPEMLEDGRFTFQQEAYVAVAQSSILSSDARRARNASFQSLSEE